MAHCDDLFQMMQADRGRFSYLPDDPDVSMEEHRCLFEARVNSADPLFYAILEKSTGCCKGRLSYMRMVPQHGVLEIGHIYFGPDISRRRIATEAVYLLLQHAFDDLGYRRVEWKCNNDNSASKNAAIRFGFRPEGVFRKHMVVKGLNRDTAWFAMLDDDWKLMKKNYENWLDESNFHLNGNQVNSLVRPQL